MDNTSLPISPSASEPEAPITLVSKAQLWQWQAPSFNFELDEDQLLAKALESGFVTETGPDAFLVNSAY